MTQRWLCLLVLVSLLGACGKYGSPIRAGAAGASGSAGVVLDHAAECNDPEHEHADPTDDPSPQNDPNDVTP